jgi:Tfp pilus assembly protein PilN
METIRTAKLKLNGMAQKAAGIRNVLAKIASPVWRALVYSPFETLLPLSVISVAISPGRVDLLHARRAWSRYSVILHRTYNHAADSLPSPDDVAADAVMFMKDSGLEKCEAVLVIPGSMLIVKSFELPAAVQNNLAEVVNFEFDRFTPLSASDAIYDYFPEKLSPDKIGIFLAAARAATVNEYVDKLAAKAFSVRRIDFDVSALAGYCRFVSGLGTAVFAGISSGGCEGGFYDEGILKTSASHKFSAEDDNGKAAELEGFITGQRKPDAAASAPVLLAFSEEASGLRSALSSRANLVFRNTAEFSEKIKAGYSAGAVWNVATGGAMGHLNQKFGGFNLLSRGVHQDGKRSYLLSGILAAAVLVCIAVWIFVPLKTERDRLKKIERQIAERKAEVAAIEKIRDEIEFINKRTALVVNFKGDKPTRIDLVRELTNIIPQNSWLTRVKVTGEKMNIEGYAQSATSLIQLLVASKYFKNVEFASPTFRDPQMNMDRFQIKMEVNEIKKEAPAGEKQ